MASVKQHSACHTPETKGPILAGSLFGIDRGLLQNSSPFSRRSSASYQRSPVTSTRIQCPAKHLNSSTVLLDRTPQPANRDRRDDRSPGLDFLHEALQAMADPGDPFPRASLFDQRQNPARSRLPPSMMMQTVLGRDRHQRFRPVGSVSLPTKQVQPRGKPETTPR